MGVLWNIINKMKSKKVNYLNKPYSQSISLLNYFSIPYDGLEKGTSMTEISLTWKAQVALR